MTTAPFAGLQNSAYGTLQHLNYPRVPPTLEAGGVLGVAALSGSVAPEALSRGVEALRAAGFDVVKASNLERRHGMFAGTDAERLEGFHDLLREPSIDAVLFARGGHGLLRVLPEIDWALMAARPRWFVGYSDLTPLLAQVVERLGWVAVHGPMVAADPVLEIDEVKALARVLAGRWPLEVELEGASGNWAAVAAPLTGGCLSLLASTVGTEWALPVGESVLFIEDVHEPLYRIDRMLHQLRLAGAFAGVRGVVLGSFEREGGESHALEVLLPAVREAVGDGVPVAWGCRAGHCRPNTALPLGARARVEPAAARLVLDLP